MRVVVNAVSAKRGGAVTYLKNVLPELRRQLGSQDGHRIVVWRAASGNGDGGWPEGIEYREDASATGSRKAIGGTISRMWFDQVRLPSLLRDEAAQGLFSSANFGPLRSPCRQVLLVRSRLIYDGTVMQRLRSRRVKAYYLFQRWLGLRCIAASDVVLFPTRAMMDLVASRVSGLRPNWGVAHYGVPFGLFSSSRNGMRREDGRVQLLFVSLYGEHKNYGTLLHAVERLRQDESGRYHLVLTAGFDQDWLAHSAFFPNFRTERALYRKLHPEGSAEDGDWRTYGSLPDLYRSADIFVFPSYTESFGHPLVEAMATGLPIAAADVPPSRELCGEAAIYFPPFDPEGCATAIRRLAGDRLLREELRGRAIKRARDFSWPRHVARLVEAFGMPPALYPGADFNV